MGDEFGLSKINQCKSKLVWSIIKIAIYGEYYCSMFLATG